MSRNNAELKVSATISLTIFAIIFAILAINTQNMGYTQSNNDEEIKILGEMNLKSSSSWSNFSFIYIDGNWSVAAAYEWCEGDGSWSNPYTIENITMDATGSPTGSGIYVNNSKNVYFTINNCTVFNGGGSTNDGGIKLENTNNGTITNNNCSDNGYAGIVLFTTCENNTLSGNKANDNGLYGVHLRQNCNNNTISGNNASNIQTSDQWRGIYLLTDCSNNTIHRNRAINNTYEGINVRINSDRNNITENYLDDNDVAAIRVYTSDCDNTIIDRNVLISNDFKFITDDGTSTTAKLNYFSNMPPSFVVEVMNQLFSTTEFIVTIKISCECTGSEVLPLLTQMWWNGTAVSSNNITELGNGTYNISLTPILVSPGDDPILLNMTISATGYSDKYSEINLAVDPEAVDKTEGSPPSPPDDGNTHDTPPTAIPGFNLLFLIGFLGLFVVLLTKKHLKQQ